jgi:hypothetical protein
MLHVLPQVVGGDLRLVLGEPGDLLYGGLQPDPVGVARGARDLLGIDVRARAPGRDRQRLAHKPGRGTPDFFAVQLGEQRSVRGE